MARRIGRCEACGGELTPTRFGPGGTVWSSTIVHLPVGLRAAGFVLVSVDLDDDNGRRGPRVLARCRDTEEPPTGSRVELIGHSDDGTGDLLCRTLPNDGPVDAQAISATAATKLPICDEALVARPVTGVAVTGVGTSHFGRFPDLRIEQLAWEATAEALTDAGVEPGDIDAVVVGSVFGPPGLANRVLAGMGLAGVPVFQVEAACASGTVAFHQAVSAVHLGPFNRVLAIGVEQLSTRFAGAIVPEPTDPDGRSGLVMPALYALQANRYLNDYDIDPQLLAHVAVKNKQNGAANPRAHLGDDTLSIQSVMESRPVAGPLTLLQCCPMTDGAAAAIIEHVDDDATPGAVTVAASRFTSGAPWGAHTDLPWGVNTVRRTANAALTDAGIDIECIDLFEVHDAFTIGEILTIEAIGLTKPGRGAVFTASGATSLDGPHPVNPSGGLLSRGHPLGATGLAQIAEAVWQLRDAAGERQVRGASTAMVETMGGGAAGVDANACVVIILRADT